MTGKRSFGFPASWNDFKVAINSLQSGSSAPAIGVILGATYIRGFGFTGATTTETVSGTIEILHQYKEGSTLKPHVHWTPSTTGAGNVVWQLEYSYANKDQAFSAPQIIKTTATAAGGMAWVHKFNYFPDIAIPDLKIGAQVAFSLIRIPTAAEGDTYADLAYPLTFGVHVECDTAGSSTDIIK